MARKETGLFESMFNAITGTGTTIRRTTDFWGNKKTVVHNYDSGTTKEYTHGQGFFGNRTDVKVKRHGRVVGKGNIKKGFFSRAKETIDYSEGRVRRTEKKYNQGFFGNRDETVLYDDSGNVIGHRKGRRGLVFNKYTQEFTGECYVCHGSGTFRTGAPCRKCNGTGVYRRSMD